MTQRKLSRMVAAGLCVAAVAVMALLREQVGTAAQTPPLPAVPQEQPAADGFVIAPYLQFATRTSIVIMCETPTPTNCVIDYGHMQPRNLQAKSKAAATIHEITLENLDPKSAYFYTATCTDADGKAIVSKELSFFTAVDPDDAWSFTVVGDTQNNPKMTGIVGAKMWNRRPNFMLHCGDVVERGPSKKDWVHELFGPCQDLFGRVPVFPCIGNHELNHPNYYTYFSLPKPEYYYSFTYGNAEFFSLDTNKSVSKGSEQYNWLDKALANSTATWKICYHHHPAFSSDDNDYGETYKRFPTAEGDANTRNLVPLYEKHKVDLVFNGHIHAYERTWPIRGGKVDRKNGITYITSGGGGGKLEDSSPTPAFFKAEWRMDYHYCYLTVHKGTLHFKAFDKDDRLFDQFSLEK